MSPEASPDAFLNNMLARLAALGSPPPFEPCLVSKAEADVNWGHHQTTPSSIISIEMNSARTQSSWASAGMSLQFPSSFDTPSSSSSFPLLSNLTFLSSCYFKAAAPHTPFLVYKRSGKKCASDRISISLRITQNPAQQAVLLKSIDLEQPATER